MDVLIGHLGGDVLVPARPAASLPRLLRGVKNACEQRTLEQFGAGPAQDGIHLSVWSRHSLCSGDKTTGYRCGELDQPRRHLERTIHRTSGVSSMARQLKTVLGFCPTRAHAEEAVDKLRLCGFRNTDVAAFMPDYGASVAGVLSWPAGAGVSKQAVMQHQEWVSRGGVVISVQCASAEWEKRAEHVLHCSVAAMGAG